MRVTCPQWKCSYFLIIHSSRIHTCILYIDVNDAILAYFGPKKNSEYNM